MSTVPNGHERTFMTATVPSLASGAVASAVAKTAIAPFDRTKINFQVSSTRKYSLRAALKFVKVTYQTTGFLSLYRGNSATLARIAPYGAIRFGAYEEFKHLLRVDRAGKRTPVRRYLAGSLAGIMSSMLLYPLDTAKARLSVSTTQEYLNLRDLIVKEYRQSGFAVFYRGMVPTLLGVIPYAGLSFGTYETLKVFHKERTDNAKLSPLLRLCFGAFAGLVGQTPSYPLDIVRRRMQTGRVPPGQGVWRTLIEIWRTEGLIGGLYKGLSMNWIKGPVASGTSFLVYDLVFNQLRHVAIAATSVG